MHRLSSPPVWHVYEQQSPPSKPHPRWLFTLSHTPLLMDATSHCVLRV